MNTYEIGVKMMKKVSEEIDREKVNKNRDINTYMVGESEEGTAAAKAACFSEEAIAAAAFGDR